MASQPTNKNDPQPQAKFNVEVYNGKHLMTVITIKAKDVEEASVKAREQFFHDIHAKVKRAW